jgi:hypothetical protein
MILLGKLGKRSRNLSIILNKAPIEVIETQERLYTFDRYRVFLVINNFDFGQVYFNSIYINNKA